MRVAIHQPHYMPWLGYLRKMREADIFVYLDNALYTKNVINRNKILINGKEHWLTIPVASTNRSTQSIKKIKVNWERRWNVKHFRILLSSYFESMHTKKKDIEKFYVAEHELLIDWDVRSIEFLCHAFGIKTPVLFESTLGINGKSTERLVNICHEVGANTYLSGPGGRKYIDEKEFGDIKVEYMDWKPKSHLSALHFYLIDEYKALEEGIDAQ